MRTASNDDKGRKIGRTRQILHIAGGCFLALVWLVTACGDARDAPTYADTSSTSSSGSSGVGGSPEVNICACMVTALDEVLMSEPCHACQASAVEAGSACEAGSNQCEDDSSCLDVVGCVNHCDDGDITDPVCFDNCINPDPDTTGAETYRDWVLCLCSQCSEQCNSYGDTVCTGGTGGTGGMGGAGGAGGG